MHRVIMIIESIYNISISVSYASHFCLTPSHPTISSPFRCCLCQIHCRCGSWEGGRRLWRIEWIRRCRGRYKAHQIDPSLPTFITRSLSLHILSRISTYSLFLPSYPPLSCSQAPGVVCSKSIFVKTKLTSGTARQVLTLPLTSPCLVLTLPSPYLNVIYIQPHGNCWNLFPSVPKPWKRKSKN